MPGPYFEGQRKEQCGCYYPDVTRVRDDLSDRTRHLFCIVHGKITEHVAQVQRLISEEESIPSDEWREEERNRLMVSII